MAVQRRTRIAARIGGNDVWMGIDNRDVHSSCRLQTSLSAAYWELRTCAAGTSAMSGDCLAPHLSQGYRSRTERCRQKRDEVAHGRFDVTRIATAARERLD